MSGAAPEDKGGFCASKIGVRHPVMCVCVCMCACVRACVRGSVLTVPRRFLCCSSLNIDVVFLLLFFCLCFFFFFFFSVFAHLFFLRCVGKGKPFLGDLIFFIANEILNVFDMRIVCGRDVTHKTSCNVSGLVYIGFR